jgi:hypothetical protein
MRIKRLLTVSVPRPCPVAWNSMTGTDKARVCAWLGADARRC